MCRGLRWWNRRDREAVSANKYMQGTETVNSQDHEAVYVVMAVMSSGMYIDSDDETGNKEILSFKLNSTFNDQSPPKTVGVLTKIFCISGPNLVILAWQDYGLWCGQYRNGLEFDF